MSTTEARRLLSYFYYANAAMIAVAGLLPALWALMPAAMMIDAPDVGFAVFTGTMVLIPLAVTLLCELAAAALVATGIAVRSGSTSNLVLFAAVMTVLLPPLGPILTVATLVLVYVERNR